MQVSDRQEINWLAFRYIANEMGASELELFEQWMADDQAVREAVARAVDLSVLIAAVPAGGLVCVGGSQADPTRRPGAVRGWLRPMRWAAALAAAVVAGVVGIQMWPRPSDVSQLATMWGKIRVGSDSLEGVDAHSGPENWTNDEEDDLTVPAWMFEAVRGESDEKWEDS